MATWAAFLRAINLGATKKFSKPAVIAATEAAGGQDVVSHLNTGNVRLNSARRSHAAVERALEASYREAAGFEVPTVVLRLDELAVLAEEVARYRETHPGALHFVSLLKERPAAAAVRTFEERWSGQYLATVGDRAVHLLLTGRDTVHGSPLDNAVVERGLGVVATSRNARVIATIAERWCR